MEINLVKNCYKDLQTYGRADPYCVEKNIKIKNKNIFFVENLSSYP